MKVDHLAGPNKPRSSVARPVLSGIAQKVLVRFKAANENVNISIVRLLNEVSSDFVDRRLMSDEL
jgi:hypothetical protein